MSQDFDPATFEVDHVVPEKMDGETVESNLALACFSATTTKARISPVSTPKLAKRRFSSILETTRGLITFAGMVPICMD